MYRRSLQRFQRRYCFKSNVDLVSSGDKPFGYLRLGRKNVLANRLSWSLMTSSGHFAFTFAVEIMMLCAVSREMATSYQSYCTLLYL
jgi:hypothetical protein